MKRGIVQYLLIIILIGLGAAGNSLWPTDVTTVILVRHAEKDLTVNDDPMLTDAGKARALTLAHVLEDAGIDVIISSQYLRTQATVAPIAALLEQTVVTIPAQDQAQLIRTITTAYRGETVLISGHSNTVPAIITALGIEAPFITDAEYDNLFIVQIQHGQLQNEVTLTVLKFGAEE